MKPQGWAIDNGMGTVRKWDIHIPHGDRGSRPKHRGDKRLRARTKRQVRREIQEAS